MSVETVVILPNGPSLDDIRAVIQDYVGEKPEVFVFPESADVGEMYYLRFGDPEDREDRRQMTVMFDCPIDEEELQQDVLEALGDDGSYINLRLGAHGSAMRIMTRLATVFDGWIKGEDIIDGYVKGADFDPRVGYRA